MTTRDTQRGKLYRAERSTAAHRVKPFGSTVEVWAYLERIERDKWFRRHFGSRRFRLHDGRGRRRGAADVSGWITLPKFARYPQYILHEVAHVVAPPGCHHDWRYAATYLKLVRHFLGAEAHRELRAAFKANRVRFCRPRTLSPQARAAAIERLAGYRRAPSRDRDVALARANGI